MTEEINPPFEIHPDCIRKEPWDDTGFNKLHEWRKTTKSLLEDILFMINNDVDMGYFDCVIDIQTDAKLIDMAIRKYVDEHNRRYDERHGSKHAYNTSLLSTKEEIEACYKGGYTQEFKNKIMRALTK